MATPIETTPVATPAGIAGTPATTGTTGGAVCERRDRRRLPVGLLADELAAWGEPRLCAVNVIPYNPRRNSPWPAPEEHVVDAFVERLRSKRVFTKRRKAKGRDQMAACGQLGTAEIRKRKYIAG